MPTQPGRRQFLTASASGSLLAMGANFGFLSQLPRLTAQEIALPAGVVQFDPDIEPLVRLIEETPRESLLEKVGHKVLAGTSYQQVLAALFLAGIRNVQPRPSVGHKFHSVLCVNSCHLASLTGPDEDRWLPIFWALDYFKSAQAEEAQRSAWRMSSVNETRVSELPDARASFIEAMENWDVELADVAVANLVRTHQANEIFQLFAQFAARDFRSIGHKAIFLANSWRTLEVIGWGYAEPVLRSLAFALLNSDGSANPSQLDLAPDRPWKTNIELVSRNWPTNWTSGKIDDKSTAELIADFRTADAYSSAQNVSSMLINGVSVQSIWDAVFVGSGELLMRQPGIVALHGLTTANAVHYIWNKVEDDTLRKRILLQACSFNTLFRDAAAARGALKPDTIEKFESVEHSPTQSPTIDTIFESISNDKGLAATQVLSYLSSGGKTEELISAARRTVFQKSRDAHDYKFSSAVLEDAAHVSENWRDRFVALSVFSLRGTQDRDNSLIQRTRSALS